MNKPKEPFKSGNYFSMPKYNSKDLSHKTYVHPDCVSNFLENQDEEDENYDKDALNKYYYTHKLPKNVEEWWYETDVFSLQDLLDLAKDIDPKQVFISVHRDRQIDHIDVSVSHRTEIDSVAWKAAKVAADEKYYQEYDEYVRLDKEYQLFLAEQELEASIAKIKKLKQ